MPETIRTVRPEELPDWFEAFSTAFYMWQSDPRALAEQRRPHIDLARTLAAFDGRTVVATYRTFPIDLTLPGATQVPVSAVTAVSVRPTHRRRGLLTRLMTDDLREAAGRGDVASILIASEWPIYGRFGYGAATWQATWTLRVRRATVDLPAIGTIEVVDAPTARAILPDVYARHAAVQPGQIGRHDARWDGELGIVDVPGRDRWRGSIAIHRDGAGTADGYARFHGEELWADGLADHTLVVDELHGTTPEAELDLWRHLASMDLTSTIRATVRREREPFTWHLSDARAARASGLTDFLWLRVLDVERALAARSYEQDGALVLEIDDRLGGDAGPAAGRYRLEVEGGRATCRRTDDEPDVAIPVRGLGAALLGGTRLVDAVRAHGAIEHRPGSLRQLDRLLRTADDPWCTTWF